MFIYVSGSFITNVLFNTNKDNLQSVGITTDTQLNIGKITIILFWIVFIPLTLLPIALFAGYGKYL